MYSVDREHKPLIPPMNAKEQSRFGFDPSLSPDERFYRLAGRYFIDQARIAKFTRPYEPEVAGDRPPVEHFERLDLANADAMTAWMCYYRREYGVDTTELFRQALIDLSTLDQTISPEPCHMNTLPEYLNVPGIETRS